MRSQDLELRWFEGAGNHEVRGSQSLTDEHLRSPGRATSSVTMNNNCIVHNGSFAGVVTISFLLSGQNKSP